MTTSLTTLKRTLLTAGIAAFIPALAFAADPLAAPKTVQPVATGISAPATPATDVKGANAGVAATAPTEAAIPAKDAKIVEHKGNDVAAHGTIGKSDKPVTADKTSATTPAASSATPAPKL